VKKEGTISLFLHISYLITGIARKEESKTERTRERENSRKGTTNNKLNLNLWAEQEMCGALEPFVWL
jgi:hypothetical protein